MRRCECEGCGSECGGARCLVELGAREEGQAARAALAVHAVPRTRVVRAPLLARGKRHARRRERTPPRALGGLGSGDAGSGSGGGRVCGGGHRGSSGGHRGGASRLRAHEHDDDAGRAATPRTAHAAWLAPAPGGRTQHSPPRRTQRTERTPRRPPRARAQGWAARQARAYGCQGQAAAAIAERDGCAVLRERCRGVVVDGEERARSGHGAAS